MKPSPRHTRTKLSVIEDDAASLLESTRGCRSGRKHKNKLPSKRTQKERRLRRERVYNSGSWTTLEKQQFLAGLKKFGPGQWRKIGTLVTTRSNIQIKSHGQKVLQRLNAGEDVFAELEWPVATVKIPLSLRSSPAGASALISASSSDEEDGASLASDGEPSYEESSDTTEDKGYEPRHFESEEALVVQALLKLADAVSLTQHLAETAAAKGPVSSCFGVVL